LSSVVTKLTGNTKDRLQFESPDHRYVPHMTHGSVPMHDTWG